MSGEYVTTRVSPAIILGHEDPHFTGTGVCICNCSQCSREYLRTPLVIEGDCICPSCPCNGVTP